MKEQLYQFQIDTFKPGFSVVIKGAAQDARIDALTIARKEFGLIARILGEGKKIRRLPDNASAAKGAVSRGKVWAWIIYTEKRSAQQ